MEDVKPNLHKIYRNYHIKSVQKLILCDNLSPRKCSVTPEMQLSGLLCKQHRMRKFPPWENWGDCGCFVTWRFFLFVISVSVWGVFFCQSIPCIQGLNIPKAFHQSTHKKICYWYSLTWPGFKCLTIAANHTQLSTCTTVFFFVLWFLMIPYLTLLSLQTRRKGLYINTSTV